jgi:dTDP-4-amino-4,6-dideoxygalactose transaminase
MIPFVDLKAQYNSIKVEIDAAIKNVIDNTSFIGGQVVSNFEKEFAVHMGVNHCIGCANGTDSLEMLLQAMNVGPGDEVIVPAISWISTSECVSTVGATPIFVDIDPLTYTIDTSLIEDAITSKTKVIIPVHLYGQPCNMREIMSIAKKHNLRVLEDCAQSHDAKFEGQKVGTFGDCASFSFYPGKNLGAYGDAGCMVTNNDEIARTVRMIANHGQEGKHNHIMEGRNSRMDGIHAAVLSVKLKYLEEWTAARISCAKEYSNRLSSEVVTPSAIDSGVHVYHLYVIRSKKRDQLKAYLEAKNIQTAIHYPTALPFMKCYEHRNFGKGSFPVARKYQDEILSLPMYRELKVENIETVCNTINEFS